VVQSVLGDQESLRVTQVDSINSKSYLGIYGPILRHPK
jgi:hypothetical protein